MRALVNNHSGWAGENNFIKNNLQAKELALVILKYLMMKYENHQKLNQKFSNFGRREFISFNLT